MGMTVCMTMRMPVGMPRGKFVNMIFYVSVYQTNHGGYQPIELTPENIISRPRD